VTERFLTTTEAAAWLLVNYGMEIAPHTLRRLAKAGTLKPHRTHRKSWYTFTRETLANHAEAQGYRRVS
jgi:DNA-binding transcriptional regulator PaaX